MSVRTRAGSPTPTTTVPSHVDSSTAGFRLAAGALLLVVVAFRQRPFRLADDTLLGAATDPAGAMHDALRTWTETDGFGALTASPAALWPAGPFFLATDALGLPVWLGQRLWFALLLVLAYTGVVALTRALDVGTSDGRLLAGVAYALSPYLTGVLTGSSGDALPIALLPWLVVPLVVPGARGHPWRAAALSGLAIASLGGASPAAALAVLPLPWLVLLGAFRPRLGLLVRWNAAATLGAVWWLAPAVLRGLAERAGGDATDAAPPDGTTALPGWVEAVAGSAVWRSPDSSGSSWDAADPALLTPAWQTGAGLGIAVVGLLGLLSLRGRLRVTWLVSAAAGFVLVLLSQHLPDAATWALPDQQRLTVWAARGVGAADPVLRLSLAVGVAAASRWSWGALRARGMAISGAQGRSAVLVAVATLVVLAAVPALAGRLVPSGTPERLPREWAEAARWLGAPGHDGRALVVPPRERGTTGAGRLHDHPLSLGGATRWAERDEQGSGSPATTRLVDEVQRRLQAAEPGPGFPTLLSRAGVRYLVVDATRDEGLRRQVRPAVVRSALGAAGFARVAAFGPATRPVADDFGVGSAAPAIEIWENPVPPERVSAYDRRALVRVVGAADALAALADTGQLARRPVVLAGDDESSAARPRAQIATDTPRRRALDRGRAFDNLSATTEGGALAAEAQSDVLPAVVRYDGIASVGASSSASDGDAVVRHRPAANPYAAVDGNRFTSWLSGSAEVTGQSWRVDFAAPTDVSAARAFVVDSRFVGPRITVVQVRTDRGVVTREVLPGGEVFLDPAPGAASWLELTFGADESTPDGGSVGLSELDLPGLSASRGLDLPAPPTSPDGNAVLARSWVFARDVGSDRVCVTHDGDPVCSPSLPSPGEDSGGIDRSFTSAGTATVEARGTVRPVAGVRLDALLAGLSGPLRARGSSQFLLDPALRPAAAVDTDPATTWVAARQDGAPELSLTWTGRRTVDAVDVSVNGVTAAARPTLLRLGAGSVERTVRLDASGHADFAPLATTRLTVQLLEWETRTTVERVAGSLVRLPPGISELRLRGLEGIDASLPPDAQVPGLCGAGPSVTLDGSEVETRVRGSAAQLLSRRELVWEACGDRPLRTVSAGRHRLVVPTGFLWDPQVAVLAETRDLGGFLTDARQVSVRRSGDESASLVVSSGPAAVLTTDSAFSVTRRATAGERVLKPVRVDGWRQGWLLPAAVDGTVEVEMPVGILYRVALAAGAAAAAVLLLVLTAPLRRRVRRRDRSMAGFSTQ